MPKTKATLTKSKKLLLSFYFNKLKLSTNHEKTYTRNNNLLKMLFNKSNT